MERKIKVKRGSKSNLPILDTGEPAFTLDTSEFFIGNGSSNVQFATTDVVTEGKNGLMDSIDKIKLDNIQENANNYVLPIATSSILGGVKPGSNIEIDSNGIISSNKGDGLYSVAEGNNNIAGGESSHAEGYNNTASGNCSHVEGESTKATGEASHAEGINTRAYGDYSHAEGRNTIANANNSHVEGNNCVVSTISSHAEGDSTLACNGKIYNITAFNDANKTITLDTVDQLSVNDVIDIRIVDSKALINITITTINGLVITLDTTETITDNWREAIKKSSSQVTVHVEGYNTMASGNYSHAEGLYNLSIGAVSHTEGDTNIATGVSSHAEGNQNKANGLSSHVEGGGNIAIGNYTHAEGYNTIAIGQSSHVEGSQNYSQGITSHIEGTYNIAINGTVYSINSFDNTNKTITLNKTDGLIVNAQLDIFSWDNPCMHALVTAINENVVTLQGIDGDITIDGNCILAIYGNLTNNQSAHVEGYNNFARGIYSHAEGEYNLAIGEASHTEGYGTEADGQYSHAEGLYCGVTGKAAHTEGYQSLAKGDYSHAEGYNTIADNFSSHASGKFNKALTTGGAINTQVGDAFVIGNGTSDTEKSNALRIDYTGAVYGTKAYNASGADYAEYFEWSDGNLNDEDRIGYFVTLDNNKIKIATTNDYILGIISANPCIIGNSDEDWLGKYLHDEFGRFIYEDVEEEIQIIDTNTRKVTIVKTGNIIKNGRLKLNPDYDSTKEYISRDNRPEWDLVGMLGVISVRDDGTCQVNGYCSVNPNGIATNSSKGIDTYRVISRTNDNIIKIIFK